MGILASKKQQKDTKFYHTLSDVHYVLQIDFFLRGAAIHRMYAGMIYVWRNTCAHLVVFVAHCHSWTPTIQLKITDFAHA